ncbi:MAG: nSTAND1 domain-containing NTPase [Candidatus Tyrphobacter sp.]
MTARFNPFPGLRPFEDSAEDIAVFFGRDDQVDELLSRLAQRRFVGVVGQSGCGKSSLVRAGLLPALHGGFMAGAGSRWRIAVMRPGSAPIESLAHALEASGALANVAEDGALRVGLTSGVLHGGARGLVEVVQQAHLQKDENVLVVVDQFEELFRFRYSVGSAYVSDEAAAFVKLLLAASRDRDVPLYVLVTMRSDFIGDCAQFRDLPETLNEGLFLVPRLTRDQLREAIAGPVGVAGAAVAPRLVNRLLNEIGDDPDQLPVLQHALMRTWDIWRAKKRPKTQIDVAEYEATGGLSEALSRHGDEILESLSTQRLRAIAERIFKALTELGGDNRGIRRPTAFARLREIADASEEEVRRAIDAFRASGVSFLMPPAQVALEESTVIDLTHEALMRTWVRLRDWVEEEAEGAKLYRRLCDNAELYAQGKGMLLADPLLSFAQEWRASNHPTAEWAQRYGRGLAGVNALIDESRAAVNAEVERRAAAERREREMEIERRRSAERLAQRTRVLASMMSVIAVLAIGAAIAAVGFAARARTAEGVARQQAAAAQRQQQIALAQRAIAVRYGIAALKQERIARREASIARQQAIIARNETIIARAAEARAVAARLQVVQYATRQRYEAGSAELAEIDHGMYNNRYDNRVAGLIGTDAYAASPTGDARSVLLTAAWTPNAIGRVALPPWDLGAVIARGRTLVVLAGARQSRYGDPVTGSLVAIDATTLAVLGRTPAVTATFVCGFEDGARVAVANARAITIYDVRPNGLAVRSASVPSAAVRAIACLPRGERVLFVDARNTLRVATLGGRGSREIARVEGSVDGIAVSNSGDRAAVATSDGNVAIYDLATDRRLARQRLFGDPASDCSALAGCAAAMTFTSDEKQVAWYDAGALHIAPIASATDASYLCAASLCAHTSLVYYSTGSTIPMLVADGGVVGYDPDKKRFTRQYDDAAGSQRRALLDRQFGMYVTPYDPAGALQPNPFHSGLAEQSFSQVQGPLRGTVPDSQWVQSFALTGHDVLIPGASGYIGFDLDHLREAFDRTYDVSYRVRMRDCGDGAHAVTFNMFTGAVQVLDIRSSTPRVLHAFTVGRVPVRAGKYAYLVSVGYDPSSGIITLLSYSTTFATVRRFNVAGHVLMSASRAQLLAHANIVPSQINNWTLSPRGNYVAVAVQSPAQDAILRPNGALVGRAYSIDMIAPNERLVIAESRSSAGFAESVYRLPDWAQVGITSIPVQAEGLAIAPDARTVAYYDEEGGRQVLHLYDYQSRASYRTALPSPPDLGKYTTLTFSADGRYLLASYDDPQQYHRLAVFAVEPGAWAKAACLMAGRSLTLEEFRSYAGSDIPYRDGCLPYANEMYRW